MSHLDLLQFHAFCLTDTGSRLGQYERAIAATVRQGDVVLDLGAGSGLLTVLACRAGASRVYAVESRDSIEMGRMLVTASGLADRVEFIKSPSTQVVLRERVDVLVADIHDTFGLQTGGLAAFADARDRLLEPQGALVPRSIQLLAAPVEDAAFYGKEIDVWARRVHGVDISPIRPFAVSSVHAGRFHPEHLLAAPAPLGVIDLAQATSMRVGGSATTKVQRDGLLHGVCGCFVTTLADGVCMGNVPGESATTNFAQAFFPLERAVRVTAGDDVFIGIDSHDGHIVRWRVEASRSGLAYARFEHSSLDALFLSPQALQRHARDYRPRLNGRGAMERALLERFDGTASAADLAAWLRERFGGLLPTEREAETFVREIVDRCG